ncbi:MAG: FkbM family methyltransferase [Cyanobacteriota bacterium]
MIYHKLLHYSRKFSNRFFLFEELSRLQKLSALPHARSSALYWQSLRRPSQAEDWIPLHRFIGHLGPLVLLDIGANIGDFTLDFAINFKVKHAYCFEPTPSTHAKLRERLDSSGLSATTLNQAVSTKRQRIPFKIYASSTLNSMYAYVAELTHTNERPEPLDVIEVESGPISKAMIQAEGDIFLKIDVQGMEADVAIACLDILDRCAAVLVEVSFLPEYEGTTPSFSSVASTLLDSDLYPVFFHEYGDSSSLYAVERDVLFVRRDLLSRAFDSNLAHPPLPPR